MRFEQYQFLPVIKKNLETLNFKRPTDIQFKAIPPILKGEDVLAIAQTGTGKTAAFAIPIVNYLAESLKKNKSKHIRCLVLEPTRELSIQITEVFQSIAKGTSLKILNVYGGVDQVPQITQLQSGVDILISTPGRMFDLIHQGYIQLDQLETFVVDEADHMLERGFLKDIQDVIRHLPHRRQTLFFSATINDSIKKLAYSIVRNAIRIQISPDNPVNKNIDHKVAFIEMDDKRFFLERLLNEMPDTRILVFVRTQVRAERVSKAMERAKIKTETIHGGKEQSERLSVLESFKTGENKVLIATDVSARGIDIPGVDYVVNYDIPEQPENYVHRVGRTGRGNKKGQAIAFCSKDEKNMLLEIEEYIGSKIDVLKIDKDSYLETVSFTEDESMNDWKTLLKEAEQEELIYKKKKKKK
jgi:ATP-dependent RNA helicase RhlE